MQRINQFLSVCAMGLCLSACTPPIDDKARDSAQERAAEDATQMRDAIQQPIQEAKKVEDMTLEAADKQRDQIDEAAQ